ncbi:MAG: peptide deformylase [Alphaproteobacteria bacterium]|nr:peptide deformylase [Alphaproteobacteria bacterium]
MALLELITAPNPVLRQRSAPVSNIDDGIRQLTADMLETMYAHRGMGIAANMIGKALRIIVVDVQPEGNLEPMICINPEVIWSSDKLVTNEEASLSFPGISADIKRPDAIKLRFEDEMGVKQEIAADGWLATVIQHEMDYLEGKTYLDHLSKMQRDRLLKKMQKYLKGMHSHGCADPHCGHDHH